MRSREEIQAEMLQVAERLDDPRLSDEEKAKEMARYNVLESELAEVTRREQEYPPDVRRAIDKIWYILDPEGKRRRRYG